MCASRRSQEKNGKGDEFISRGDWHGRLAPPYGPGLVIGRKKAIKEKGVRTQGILYHLGKGGVPGDLFPLEEGIGEANPGEGIGINFFPINPLWNQPEGQLGFLWKESLVGNFPFSGLIGRGLKPLVPNFSICSGKDFLDSGIPPTFG